MIHKDFIGFVVHKDFIGMHPLERTSADQVVAILKNALLRINFNIQRARPWAML